MHLNPSLHRLRQLFRDSPLDEIAQKIADLKIRLEMRQRKVG
jgi:hypothetical protein